MSFLNPPDRERPPEIRDVPPLKVGDEVDRAVKDEEERRRRIDMNRQKSRLKLPELQDTLSSVGANKL